MLPNATMHQRFFNHKIICFWTIINLLKHVYLSFMLTREHISKSTQLAWNKSNTFSVLHTLHDVELKSYNEEIYLTWYLSGLLNVIEEYQTAYIQLKRSIIAKCIMHIIVIVYFLNFLIKTRTFVLIHIPYVL